MERCQIVLSINTKNSWHQIFQKNIIRPNECLFDKFNLVSSKAAHVSNYFFSEKTTPLIAARLAKGIIVSTKTKNFANKRKFKRLLLELKSTPVS